MSGAAPPSFYRPDGVDGSGYTAAPTSCFIFPSSPAVVSVNGLKSGRIRFPDTHSSGRVKPTAMKRAVRLQGFARQDSGDDRSPICDPENQSLSLSMQLAD